MKQPSPPRGWKKLHDLAQNESDPATLAILIERLNSLLDDQQKRLTTQAKKRAAGEIKTVTKVRSAA
jgi:hypothetical protein